MTSPRDDLTRRLVIEVAANGLGDRSLRDLAAAVDSSHRMLLYHFGSRDGLVAAVVELVEADQRAVLAELATAATGPGDLIRRLWHRVSAPEVLPFVRLFFETVAHRGAADLTAPWIEDSAPITESLGIAFHPAGIRLGVAVTRGLLVDVILTGDVDAATESLELFISIWEASTRPDRHPRPSTGRTTRSGESGEAVRNVGENSGVALNSTARDREEPTHE